MKIKNIFGFFIFGALLFSCYIQAAPVNLDKIVAVVNSDVITQKELNKKMAFIQRIANAPGSSSSSLRQKALDELIDVSLQLQLAKTNKIQITNAELDGVIANIAKNNGLTVAQLKVMIPEKEGVSFNEFRNLIREQGTISRLQQQFLGRELVVTEKEINEVLRNPPKMDRTPAHYHVTDILFEIPDDATKDQRAVIAEVANKMAVRLRKGASAESVVADSQQNLKGQVVQNNDLGWRKADDFPELFAKEVVKMKANDVVGPLNAPNGVHLLKMLEIQGAASQTGKLKKDQASEIVYYHKLAKKLKPWLQELRDKAYIKISQ
ncbi:MAG: peptidylprolyl isomerase [Gammaproteobacteria bacterium]|nr:peptidylprolyl isomerase [Gammaproteobacteria bacterium]